MIERVQMVPGGPVFSAMAQGYWRLADWKLNAQQCLSFVKTHVELGITTVDLADIYGNHTCEALFGEALRLEPGLRDRIEIVSKCGIVLPKPGSVAHYHTSEAAIIRSVETSLKSLGTDYLDAFLIHRPDYLMDADEVAGAFAHLKRRGMVRHFGVSNFSVAQLRLLQARLDDPLITDQIELNPINLHELDNGILEWLQQSRVRPMAWSCLGGGAIFTEQSERMQRLRDVLTGLAGELGAASIDQVMYAWVMRMPSGPVPILGSGNAGRIRSAVGSAALSMNREQWYRVWTASKGHPVP
jgi:predicted oxidoreductase